jgi:hypothetical protein
MKLSKLFKSHPKDRHLLVVDYSPNQSRLAYFQDEGGELIFGSASSGPNIASAYQALTCKPEHFTDCVLGIPYQSVIDNSTVVRYRRQNSQAVISEDEISGALAQATVDNPETPFFEDLFSAKVDGLTTLSPVGKQGEVIELNFYQSFMNKQHIKELIQITNPLHTRPGIVPAAYAIGKLITQSGSTGAIILDIDNDLTEAIVVANSHLVGIKSFDVGTDNLDLYTIALESALEDMGFDDLWPEKIYLIGNSERHEELRSKLLAYPWTKNFNLMSFPEISLFHPLSGSLTQPADVGINALSLLG